MFALSEKIVDIEFYLRKRKMFLKNSKKINWYITLQK